MGCRGSSEQACVNGVLREFRTGLCKCGAEGVQNRFV